jgi:hypothetical protein
VIRARHHGASSDPREVGQERVDEVAAVLQRLTCWVRGRPDVRAVALVGSWANGTAHEGSDVDVVMLSDSPERYVLRDDWPAEVGGVRIVRTVCWGGATERRFALPSGLEVELDVGPPTWASTDPLDPGTRRVVSDGMRVLHDPDGLLARLIGACTDPAAAPATSDRSDGPRRSSAGRRGDVSRGRAARPASGAVRSGGDPGRPAPR